MYKYNPEFIKRTQNLYWYYDTTMIQLAHILLDYVYDMKRGIT